MLYVTTIPTNVVNKLLNNSCVLSNLNRETIMYKEKFILCCSCRVLGGSILLEVLKREKRLNVCFVCLTVGLMEEKLTCSLSSGLV